MEQTPNLYSRIHCSKCAMPVEHRFAISVKAGWMEVNDVAGIANVTILLTVLLFFLIRVHHFKNSVQKKIPSQTSPS